MMEKAGLNFAIWTTSQMMMCSRWIYRPHRNLVNRQGSVRAQRGLWMRPKRHHIGPTQIRILHCHVLMRRRKRNET